MQEQNNSECFQILYGRFIVALLDVGLLARRGSVRGRSFLSGSASLFFPEENPKNQELFLQRLRAWLLLLLQLTLTITRPLVHLGVPR